MGSIRGVLQQKKTFFTLTSLLNDDDSPQQTPWDTILVEKAGVPLSTFCHLFSFPLLGPPVAPFLPFFGGGFL